MSNVDTVYEYRTVDYGTIYGTSISDAIMRLKYMPSIQYGKYNGMQINRVIGYKDDSGYKYTRGSYEIKSLLIELSDLSIIHFDVIDNPPVKVLELQ